VCEGIDTEQLIIIVCKFG